MKKWNKGTGLLFLVFFLGVSCVHAVEKEGIVTKQIFEKVKQNANWKVAFLTAKEGQVVFMNINPKTNPQNEIGMETHPFDQIIFVIEGDAKTVLNGKTDSAKAGDMIFIPEGVAHNVINLNANKPLKILSVYSSTDMPDKTSLATKPKSET